MLISLAHFLRVFGFRVGNLGFCRPGLRFRELIGNHAEQTINNETEAIVITRIQGLGLGEIYSLELHRNGLHSVRR